MMKRLTALVLALLMALTATAALAEDWTSVEDWQSIDWDSKPIAYQFIGNWSLEEYNIYYVHLINLYEDGSVMVDQRSANGHVSNLDQTSSLYFGYWTEEMTEDGNEINLVIKVTTMEQETYEYVAHEYEYFLYEESDGNYSFGFDFCMVPGQYYRVVDVIGGKDVTYESREAFHTAVDVAEEAAAE